MSDIAQALIYTGPGLAELRDVPIDPMQADWVEIETIASALSRGTERLVFGGLVPSTEYERMRAPFQSGRFPFPVKYGYCAVGRVIDGPPKLLGENVFCLHPHQTRFRVPVDAIAVLPSDLPAARAVIAANAETALNAIWDAELKPGMTVLVVGAGLLGCLISAFLSARPDLTTHCIDVLPERGATLSEFRVSFMTGSGSIPPVDVAIHTSATSAGLQTCINALKFEGEVVELSWFGDNPVTLDLGGAFHSQRLRIRASQVGHVAAARRASTSYADRMRRALWALRDPRLDALITEELPFPELPASLPRLLGPGAQGIATRITY